VASAYNGQLSPYTFAANLPNNGTVFLPFVEVCTMPNSEVSIRNWFISKAFMPISLVSAKKQLAGSREVQEIGRGAYSEKI